MEPGGLSIEDRPLDGRHTLVLRGELDIATAPDLEALMVELCTGDAREVVLDLSDLDVLDSTGLRAILIAKELCETHGCGFLMTRGKESVQRLLETSGALQGLPFL
jgi:anti-sigma B factor antagonist